MKKTFIVLAVMALLVLAFSLSISAAEYTDGEIKYTLTKGATENENTAIINDHKGTSFKNTVITIPAYIIQDGEKYYVTDMAETAFESTNITKIFFDPDCKITRIRNFAFKNCASLTTIVFPSKLEKIHWQAFYCCSNLTAVYLPDTVTEIGYHENGNPGKNYKNDAVYKSEKVGAFFGCSKLYFVNDVNETEKPEIWYAPKALVKLSGEGFKEITTLNPIMVFDESFIRLERGYAFANKNGGDVFTLIFKGDFTHKDAMFQLCCELKSRNMFFTHPNVKDKNVFSYDTNYKDDAPTANLYLCSSETAYTLSGTAPKSETPTYTAIASAHFIEQENVGARYDNYFEKGYALDACYCGKTISKSNAELEPVFESRGVSVPTFDGAEAAVTQGIKVNREALLALSNVDFGLVVDVNVSGEAYCPISNGATTRSLIDSAINYFDIKVSGIPSAHCDTAIVFCAYVSVGGEIFYLDNGATYKTVTGISYNSLKGQVQ